MEYESIGHKVMKVKISLCMVTVGVVVQWEGVQDELWREHGTIACTDTWYYLRKCSWDIVLAVGGGGGVLGQTSQTAGVGNLTV